MRDQLPSEGCAAAVSELSLEPRDLLIDTEPILVRAEKSMAAKYLCVLGSQLGDTLLMTLRSEYKSLDVYHLDFRTFKVLRALFELLKDLRVEAAAHEFLVRIQCNIEKTLLAHSCEDFDPIVCCIRVAFAWVHGCIGDSLKDLGDYSSAISMWKRAIQEFAAIPGLAPSHVICELHRSMGVVHDLEKRYEEALSEFELARFGAAALAGQHATKTSSINQSDSALESLHLDELQRLISDFNNSQDFSSNSSRLQIFSADIDKEVANVLFSLHRFEDALNCYRSVYSTLKRVLGETHPVTARAIWGVGTPPCPIITHIFDSSDLTFSRFVL
jgi:tetratricopeptide (TPR) repeat protein